MNSILLAHISPVAGQIIPSTECLDRIQRDILYLLAGRHRNLCVVGDDDQSIYMFRGALPEIMLQFPEDYANASSISMSTNYRSGQAIVDLASRLIAMHRPRSWPKMSFLSTRQRL